MGREYEQPSLVNNGFSLAYKDYIAVILEMEVYQTKHSSLLWDRIQHRVCDLSRTYAARSVSIIDLHPLVFSLPRPALYQQKLILLSPLGSQLRGT